VEKYDKYHKIVGCNFPQGIPLLKPVIRNKWNFVNLTAVLEPKKNVITFFRVQHVRNYFMSTFKFHVIIISGCWDIWWDGHIFKEVRKYVNLIEIQVLATEFHIFYCDIHPRKGFMVSFEVVMATGWRDIGGEGRVDRSSTIKLFNFSKFRFFWGSVRKIQCQ